MATVVAPPAAVHQQGDVARSLPGLIKRNLVLLALSQAIVGIGTQMVPTLGAIMAVQLFGSAAYAGLATSTIGVSRLMVAYPVGQLTDRRGRVAGLLLGHALSGVGAAGLALSAALGSAPLFLIGLIVFGSGVGANQQLRLAAADLFLPSRRAEGLGYVLSGSLLGALLAPVLVSTAQTLAPPLGIDPIVAAWALLPFVVLPSMLLLSRVRPDPREIASNLARYYRGYVAPPSSDHSRALEVEGVRTWLRDYPRLVAFVASGLAQGSMTMMMAMTSYALAQHAYPLSTISVSVAIHVVGMFGFSLPLGALADRLGRRPILLAGTVVLAAGAVLVPTSQEYWVITAGTFLVGLGWSCVNIASSALIADTTAPALRGRAIGVVDTFAGGASIALPLLAGPLVDRFALPAIGVLGVLLMTPPFLLLLRLPETRRRTSVIGS